MGISQVFKNQFYLQSHPANIPQVGDLYRVPVTYLRQVPQIMQVKRKSPEDHDIVDFEFVEAGSQHFKPATRLPIKLLHLDDTEELMVNRAKLRPCVVIAKGQCGDIVSLPSAQQRKAKQLGTPVYLVAPLYSCATIDETEKVYGPIITARVKALRYPHMFYLPKHQDPAQGSILRLDHLFPAFLGRGCERIEKSVNPAVMQIILAQLQILCGSPAPDIYKTIREEIDKHLPAGLK